MGLLVVGSVAFDSVETPFGKAEDALGGSATFFSTSASYFTDVSLVAVVGDDFPEKHINFLKTRKIDLKGLQRTEGKTFRWKGKYGYDLNEAHTLSTELNVFESFKPKIPAEYKDAEVVFLANIDPDLQRDVLGQVKKPKIVAADTMNFWIEGKRDSLIKTLKLVDILLINDSEARQLSGEPNLVKAARKIAAYGPKTIVIKRGEHGVLMFHKESVFSAPAMPLEDVFDPTGAGDTFGGGFMGYLSSVMDWSENNMRKAIIMGSVMASFNVEDFSLNRIKNLEYSEIEARYREFKKLAHFEDI
ncbi:MAG: PfkB family carbohydrate kinase [Thermodesulfovibrionales bacterium]|nr:PfkB family carbohydrate kinase [Thermodesulfovibrionales bacterium]